MSGNTATICNRHVIMNVTVMPEVGERHQEIMVTDNRGLSFTRGAMQCHKFAKHIIVPSLQVRRLAFVFSVLRVTADNRPLPDRVSITHRGATAYHSVRFHDAVRPENNARFDHAKRTDRSPLA